MPRGGKRLGSGRKAGTPNKATADIKALAQVYGSAAIKRLAEMSGLTPKEGAKNEQTRLAAIRELLDRGYGKPAQAITGPDGGAFASEVTVVEKIYRWEDKKPE